MMWSLLRHSPCVMLYRLRKTTNIFDMTIPKADEVFFLSDSPHWAMASSFTRFLDHTQLRTTVGRSPMDK
jgi:hypothetical protein